MNDLSFLTMGLEENLLLIDSLTKSFGKDKGVFDIFLAMKRGEAFAILGESGAGKSTLLRLIMQFVHPDEGKIELFGRQTEKGNLPKEKIAYVPGEINFPDLPSGKAFLLEQMALSRQDCRKKADELIQSFQLDITARPKKMSKGMKEKLALVSALMANKNLLLLDEPTNGLDPLMREVFLQWMKREKEEGKTILLVSNDYEEVEAFCDKAILLKKGRIDDILDINALSSKKERIYLLSLKKEDRIPFPYERTKEGKFLYLVHVLKEKQNEFVQFLSQAEVDFVYEKKEGLRTYFEERRKKEDEGKE